MIAEPAWRRASRSRAALAARSIGAVSGKITGGSVGSGGGGGGGGGGKDGAATGAGGGGAGGGGGGAWNSYSSADVGGSWRASPPSFGSSSQPERSAIALTRQTAARGLYICHAPSFGLRLRRRRRRSERRSPLALLAAAYKSRPAHSRPASHRRRAGRCEG